MLSKNEKENILLSAYAFSSSIDIDEEVTFDSLLSFVAETADVPNNQHTEIVLRDFMVFAGEEKTTLDSLTDETLGDSLKNFADSFENRDEVFGTIEAFLDETTTDKACDARHAKHITYHNDGSKSVICKLKKGAIHKKRTMKQKLADARRKNKRLSASTRLKIAKALKKRAKGH